MYFVFPANLLHDDAHRFAPTADQFCKRLDTLHINSFRLPRKLSIHGLLLSRQLDLFILSLPAGPAVGGAVPLAPG
jgi:hypothetical protein